MGKNWNSSEISSYLCDHVPAVTSYYQHTFLPPQALLERISWWKVEFGKLHDPKFPIFPLVALRERKKKINKICNPFSFKKRKFPLKRIGPNGPRVRVYFTPTPGPQINSTKVLKFILPTKSAALLLFYGKVLVPKCGPIRGHGKTQKNKKRKKKVKLFFH